mmetsp:Transcript_173747/g.556847  ORF Transcript_173747/g.556847 Transcript_173747/m.556847 type:complete len:420 (-) Transcript_173747:13-1272(-)
MLTQCHLTTTCGADPGLTDACVTTMAGRSRSNRALVCDHGLCCHAGPCSGQGYRKLRLCKELLVPVWKNSEKLACKRSSNSQLLSLACTASVFLASPATSPSAGGRSGRKGSSCTASAVLASPATSPSAGGRNGRRRSSSPSSIRIMRRAPANDGAGAAAASTRGATAGAPADAAAAADKGAACVCAVRPAPAAAAAIAEMPRTGEVDEAEAAPPASAAPAPAAAAPAAAAHRSPGAAAGRAAAAVAHSSKTSRERSAKCAETPARHSRGAFGSRRKPPKYVPWAEPMSIKKTCPCQFLNRTACLLEALAVFSSTSGCRSPSANFFCRRPRSNHARWPIGTPSSNGSGAHRPALAASWRATRRSSRSAQTVAAGAEHQAGNSHGGSPPSASDAPRPRRRLRLRPRASTAMAPHAQRRSG